MIANADVRFKSSGADAVAATAFALPIEVAIDRPNAEAAFAEARRLADLLRSESSATDVPGGRVELIEPSARSRVTIEQRSRGEVRLELTLWLKLTPPPGVDFWERTLAIGRVTDLAQRFALRPHGKGVEVAAGRAEALTSSTLLSPPDEPF